MRPAYPIAAIALGLAGLGVVEVAGRSAGVLTALTPHLWLDGVAYALSALLLALAFRRTFRHARRLALPIAVLGFVLLFAPVAGLVAAAFAATLDGLWGSPGPLRGAFVNTPINLVYTFGVDLAYVALPLGLVSASLLAWLARRGPRGGTRRS